MPTKNIYKCLMCKVQSTEPLKQTALTITIDDCTKGYSLDSLVLCSHCRDVFLNLITDHFGVELSGKEQDDKGFTL